MDSEGDFFWVFVRNLCRDGNGDSEKHGGKKVRNRKEHARVPYPGR